MKFKRLVLATLIPIRERKTANTWIGKIIKRAVRSEILSEGRVSLSPSRSLPLNEGNVQLC